MAVLRRTRPQTTARGRSTCWRACLSGCCSRLGLARKACLPPRPAAMLILSRQRAYRCMLWNPMNMQPFAAQKEAVLQGSSSCLQHAARTCFCAEQPAVVCMQEQQSVQQWLPCCQMSGMVLDIWSKLATPVLAGHAGRAVDIARVHPGQAGHSADGAAPESGSCHPAEVSLPPGAECEGSAWCADGNAREHPACMLPYNDKQALMCLTRCLHGLLPR